MTVYIEVEMGVPPDFMMVVTSVAVVVDERTAPNAVDLLSFETKIEGGVFTHHSR